MGRVAVALLTILPLLPTLRAPFIYDDTTVIRDNATLRGWDAVARVWTSPYWPADGPQSLGLYRPLQLALLSIVWNLGHGSAGSFHVYALTLALGASFSMWWLLRRSTTAVPALIAALWFATHPLHIEAVASVANTSELIVFIATVGMVRVLIGSSARDNWWRPLALCVLAAGALAAKESGLFALPVAVVTAWGWSGTHQAEGFGEFVRARVRYWVAAVLGVVLVIALRLAVLGSPVSHGSIAAQGLDTLSFGERVLAMMSLWPKIAGMVIWPSALAPYYGPTSFPEQRVLAALAGCTIVMALIVLAVRAFMRGDRRPMVALNWIVLTYLPASNLLTPTGQILSDRTLFGVTAGAALLLAWMIDVSSHRMLRVARLIWIVVLAHNLLVGSRYAQAWTSHRALWGRLHEVAPNEPMSYKLLGMDARARGDYRGASVLLSRALTLKPSDRQIRFELGQAQYSAGAFADAVRTLSPLLRDTDVRSEPGFIALYLDAAGRSGGAPAVITAARPLLHSESGAVVALFLGTALEQTGDFAGADSAYAAGLRRNPADSALTSRLHAVRARAR
jgi:Flp pilus assembly protein TadD